MPVVYGDLARLEGSWRVAMIWTMVIIDLSVDSRLDIENIQEVARHWSSSIYVFDEEALTIKAIKPNPLTYICAPLGLVAIIAVLLTWTSP